MRYGKTVETDLRLSKLVEREHFLLSVIMPRFRTLADMRKEWVRRTIKLSVLIPSLIVIVLHIGAAAICTQAGSSVCAGGPELDADQDGWTAYAFKEYGPPMINALATLMLSFYANVCMNLYTEGYFAARQLQESILDVITMVAGTIPTQMRDVRMEFWRCVNLHHLCTYVLADKQRATYNLDNFLVPVASAYGEWDNESKLGMLRQEELELLHTSPARVKKLKKAAEKAAEQGSGVGETTTKDSLRRTVTKMALGKNVDAEQSELRREKHRNSSKHGSSHGVVGYEGHSKTLANSRGDVSSPAAIMHAALGVRLYQLVDLVLEEKLSRAAWPAWNAVCMKLRSNSERLKQRALFRLPRIYQASVRFLVASTILTDTYLLASHAARLLRNVQADEGWMQHSYVGAAIDLGLNLLLTWCLSVFLDAIGDMQTPFGGEPLDMPGLSYVCGAAEVSLRMVVGAATTKESARKRPEEAPNKLFAMLNRPLDKEAFLREMPKPEEGEGRKKKNEEEEEEEEDGGDE